jgi:Zn-dependent membrane protease YugP
VAFNNKGTLFESNGRTYQTKMETYIIFIVPVLVISMIVQWRFRSKFSQYSEMHLSSGFSGQEVAQKMLQDNGIYDVKVMSTEGQLSDHYNPRNKTVNLSTDVYHGRSVAAAAVAAHECGHAIQDSKRYQWLYLRSEMVPVVSLSSNLLQWVMIFGILLIGFTGNPTILSIGVFGLALVTMFSLITLPVELDASKRALLWLSNNQTVMPSAKEHRQAKDALWWAAMTYIIAAIGSLGNLVYYTGMLFGRGGK